MKKLLAAILLLAPQVLLAQPPAGELERALAELVEHVRQGRYRQALEAGGRTEELAAAADRKPELVAARTAVGDAHLGAGDPAAALASFRAALGLAREIGDGPAIADNLLRIGKIHAREGRLPAAAETLRRGLAAAEVSGDRIRIRDARLALAETYAALGSFDRAYEELRRHGELDRELAAEAGAGRLAELERRLEAVREGLELEVSGLRRELAEERRTLASRTGRSRAFAGLAIAAGVGLLALAWSRHRLALRGARELAARSLAVERTTAELGETRGELERTAAELERTAAAHTAASAELERTGELLAATSAALEQQSTALDESAIDLGRTQSELEELRRRYRRDVAELTSRSAQSESRAAEMDRCLSTVSQHLKILLVTIRGALSSLEEQETVGAAGPPPGEIAHARLAAAEVVRLLDRLQQLLLVGRMVHPPETVSLSELAFEAVAQVADLVAGRGVEIVIAPDMPPVVGDREQLLEVLRQLLDNGGRYLGGQPVPRLEVGWRRGPNTEPPVFFVRDNGTGIDPRDHGKIFTLFERLDAQARGDGIGLALVRRIVEAHDGRVWIESEGAGRGTTVCFTLSEPGPPSRGD